MRQTKLPTWQLMEMMYGLLLVHMWSSICEARRYGYIYTGYTFRICSTFCRHRDSRTLWDQIFHLFSSSALSYWLCQKMVTECTSGTLKPKVRCSISSDRMAWQNFEIEFTAAITFEPGFTATSVIHPATYLNKVLVASSEGSLQLWNIRTQ